MGPTGLDTYSVFCACSRTQLEAAARNDWLEGLVSLEYEMWGEALKKFMQSEKIYRQVRVRHKKVLSFILNMFARN